MSAALQSFISLSVDLAGVLFYGTRCWLRTPPAISIRDDAMRADNFTQAVLDLPRPTYPQWLTGIASTALHGSAHAGIAPAAQVPFVGRPAIGGQTPNREALRWVPLSRGRICSIPTYNPLALRQVQWMNICAGRQKTLAVSPNLGILSTPSREGISSQPL